jgi:cell division protein FtsN
MGSISTAPTRPPIYYRAMVGPFASIEKAAGMCKTLKAAGGNCVIQRY